MLSHVTKLLLCLFFQISLFISWRVYFYRAGRKIDFFLKYIDSFSCEECVLEVLDRYSISDVEVYRYASIKYSRLYLPCRYLPCRFPLFSLGLFPHHDRDGMASENSFFLYFRCRQCFRSCHVILKCKKVLYALLMRSTTGFWSRITSFILHYIRFRY